MATTRLYAPRPYDSLDFGISGVAPILASGTDVDNTKVAAVQAASVAGGYGTLPTSAGGVAPTPVAEPLRARGAWQANTSYSYGDVVYQGGVQYVAPSSFMSGSSFVAGNWTKLGTYDATDPSFLATYETVVVAPAPTGSDQSTTLNAAMAALSSAGGGVYVLRAGTYVGDTLKIPSNVTLRGHSKGYTTYQHMLTAVGDAVIYNLTYYTFAAGGGAPDPSWTPRETNLGIENLTVDGNSLTNRYGIILRPCSNVHLRNVKVKNTTLVGAQIQASDNVRIDNYESTNTSLNGLYVADCTNFRVDGVFIDGSGDYGVEIGSGLDYGSSGSPALPGQGTVSNVIARNCTNYGVCARGFKDATANPSNRPLRSVSFSNITVYGNGYGIGMQELAQGITWTGVTSRLNTQGALISVGAGGPTGRSKIEGTFSENTQAGITAVTATDIDFDIVALRNGRDGMNGGYTDCTIRGTIRNNGTSASATYDNIRTDNFSTDVSILGADLMDRGSRTARYDLNGSTQTRIMAKGCIIGTQSGMQYATDAEVRTVVRQTMAAGTGGAIDPRAGGYHVVTLTGSQSGATFDIPGAADGTIITVEWVQGGTGSYNYIWPTSFQFAGGAAPAKSTTVGYGDSVTVVWDATRAVWREISRAVAIH